MTHLGWQRVATRLQIWPAVWLLCALCWPQTSYGTSKPLQACGPLTKELLSKHAKNNVVMVTCMDKLVFEFFGKSWIENVKLANISFWFVAALDPYTSQHVAAMGVTQCFNAPAELLSYKGQDSKYHWGSHHWHMTTWNKVHVMKAVYELGFHVLHSDTDVTWFNDPTPFLLESLGGPAHALFATDMVDTRNGPKDTMYELETTPWININTGIYFVRQFPDGPEWFRRWLDFKPRNVGHDQDGLNAVVRGRSFRGDKTLGEPIWEASAYRGTRVLWCAVMPNVSVAFLPASMFGNAYTYVNSHLHERVQHALYEIHWVWGGSTLESKRQNMRDALRYLDPPDYYQAPSLVSMDLQVPEMPSGYNQWPDDRTEEMIQFHVKAADAQLQQAYYGFAIALALNRTFVLPEFQCFCSKNWYMTQACRINNERHSLFPFSCALSHVMRVKKLTGGMLRAKLPGERGSRVVHVRERSFLSNPHVPEGIKKSVAVIQALPEGKRSEEASSTAGPSSQLEQLKSMMRTIRGEDGKLLVSLPWPLNDVELAALLQPIAATHVLHFPQPGAIFKDFKDARVHRQFDMTISRLTTHWCCRSPKDMKALNATDKIQLQILPPHRQALLPPPLEQPKQ